MAAMTDVLASPLSSPYGSDDTYCGDLPSPKNPGESMRRVFTGSSDTESEDEWKDFIRSVAGEALVTFLFFFTVLSVGVNTGRGSAPENPAIASLGTAFAAACYVFAFGDVSGAHFNPTVTFSLIVSRNISPLKGAAYILVQCVSCTLAVLALMLAFPGTKSGASIPSSLVVSVNPSASIGNAFVIELLMSFILPYLIHAVAVDKGDAKLIRVDSTPGSQVVVYGSAGTTKNDFAPIVVGMAHGFLVLMAGTSSGGAFNPARALAPTLLSGNNWKQQWLYWVAGLTGGALAGITQNVFATKPKKFFS